MRPEYQPSEPCPVCKQKLHSVKPSVKGTELNFDDDAGWGWKSTDRICITGCRTCGQLLEYNCDADKVIIMRPRVLEELKRSGDWQFFLFCLGINALTKYGSA